MCAVPLLAARRSERARADSGNFRVRTFDTVAQQTASFSGSGLAANGYPQDGPAFSAVFSAPAGLAWDEGAQTLYVADDTSVRAVAFPSGAVRTLAGGGVPGFVDGTGAAARFSGAVAVALDAVGRMLYVADGGNGAVRALNLSSGVVRTVAGGGSAAWGSPNAPEGDAGNGTFRSPSGIAFLTAGPAGGGMLVVSESRTNRLRFVDPVSGGVSTLAGGALGFAGLVDGVGVSALFSAPGQLVAADASLWPDLAFLSDAGNNVVRRVSLASWAYLQLDVSADSPGTEHEPDAAQYGGPFQNQSGAPHADPLHGAYEPQLYQAALYQGASVVAGAYSLLNQPGGVGADVNDQLEHWGEEHSLQWCAYGGGGAGSLVLRGAMVAQLSLLNSSHAARYFFGGTAGSPSAAAPPFWASAPAAFTASADGWTLTSANASAGIQTAFSAFSCDYGQKLLFSLSWTDLAAPSASAALGFALSSANASLPLGGDAHSVGCFRDGSCAGAVVGGGGAGRFPGFASGDVVDAAVDVAAGLLWLRVNGGDWNGATSADPSSGVGGVALSLQPPYLFAISAQPHGAATLLPLLNASLPVGFTHVVNAQLSLPATLSSWTGALSTDLLMLELEPLIDAFPGAWPPSLCINPGASDSADVTVGGNCAAAAAAAVAACPVSVSAAVDANASADSAAGFSLDGPGLHVGSDEYAFEGGMEPGETLSLSVTLPRGAAFAMQLWGAALRVTVTMAGTGGTVLTLFNASGGAQPAYSLLRVPAGAGCGCLTSPNSDLQFSPAAGGVYDGTCVFPGLPAVMGAQADTGGASSPSPTFDSWFSLGVFSLAAVSGALVPPLQPSQVVPPTRLSTAGAQALLSPRLAPGLYFMEWFGPFQDIVLSLYEVQEAGEVAASAFVPDAGQAPLVTFGLGGPVVSSDNSSGLFTGEATSTSWTLAGQLFPGGSGDSLSGDFFWGTPYQPGVPTDSDPYGATLPGGAKRVYFAVPPRDDAVSLLPAGAQGASGSVRYQAPASGFAWLPSSSPTAEGAVSRSTLGVRVAALVNLTGVTLPSAALGGLVSPIYATLPTWANRDEAALGVEGVTIILPFDTSAVAVTAAAAGGDGLTQPALQLLASSDVTGSDWHVLPFVNFLPADSDGQGLVTFQLSYRCLLTISIAPVFLAVRPAYGSSGGATALQILGSGLARLAGDNAGIGGRAFCVFDGLRDGGHGGPETAETMLTPLLAPPATFASDDNAYVHCFTPSFPFPSQLPRFLSMQLFDSIRYSRAAFDTGPPGWSRWATGAPTTPSADAEGDILFLFTAPPQPMAVQPSTVSSAGGGLMRLSGQYLAPPGPSLTSPDDWGCAVSVVGGVAGGVSENVQAARVVSSALIVCEVPFLSGAQGGAFGGRVRVGVPLPVDPTLSTLSVSDTMSPPIDPYPDSPPLSFAFDPPPSPLQSAAAASTGAASLSSPHGGEMVQISVSGASITARKWIQLGTVSLLASPGPTPGAWAAAAAATAAASPIPVRLALLGWSQSEPSQGEAFLPILPPPPPPSPDAHPSALARGSAALLTVASDFDSATKNGEALLCASSGGVSQPAQTSATSPFPTILCPLPPMPPGRAAALALWLHLDGGAAPQRGTASVFLLPPSTLRSARPGLSPTAHSQLRWLSGSALLSPPAHGGGELVCVGAESNAFSSARAHSGALVACEALPGAGSLALALFDSNGANANAPLQRSNALPVSPASAAAAQPALLTQTVFRTLPPSGGASLTLSGVRFREFEGELSCAFGTTQPVAARFAPSADADSHAIECISPARAPSLQPVPVRLALPGGWRAEGAAWAEYREGLPQPAAAWFASSIPSGALVGAVSVLLRLPTPLETSTTTTGFCHFGGAASTPAFPDSAGLLRCSYLAAAQPPAFVALSLGSLRAPGDSVGGFATVPPFGGAEGTTQLRSYAPQQPRAVFPTVAPLGGGAVLWISGKGLREGSSCAFDGGGTSAVAFASSALVRCESGGGWTGGALSLASSAFELEGAGDGGGLEVSAATAPVTFSASPVSGETGGGTLVTLSGRDFTSVQPSALQCAFGTVRVSAYSVNATAVSCVAPAAVPGRVALEAGVAGWGGGGRRLQGEAVALSFFYS